MRETGATVEERDFAKRPLTVVEIEELIGLAGGVSAVLSTRNATVKERGWAASPPDAAEFAAAAAADNNLIRRPILVVDGQLVVGKDLDAIRRLLLTP